MTPLTAGFGVGEGNCRIVGVGTIEEKGLSGFLLKVALATIRAGIDKARVRAAPLVSQDLGKANLIKIYYTITEQTKTTFLTKLDKCGIKEIVR